MGGWKISYALNSFSFRDCWIVNSFKYSSLFICRTLYAAVVRLPLTHKGHAVNSGQQPAYEYMAVVGVSVVGVDIYVLNCSSEVDAVPLFYTHIFIHKLIWCKCLQVQLCASAATKRIHMRGFCINHKYLLSHAYANEKGKL